MHVYITIIIEFDIDYYVGEEEEVQDKEMTCMDILSLPELS